MLDKELHVVMHAKESLESANAKIDVEETSKTVRSKLQHLVKLRATLASTRQCRRAKQEAFIKTKRWKVGLGILFQPYSQLFTTAKTLLQINACIPLAFLPPVA